MKISKYFHYVALAMMVGAFAGCSEDSMSVRTPDYNPNYKGNVAADEADYTFDYNAHTLEVKFTSDMAWSAAIYDSNGDPCSWATVSPENGELPAGTPEMAGVAKEPVSYTVTVKIDANADYDNDRTCSLKITTPKDGSKSVTFMQEHRFDVKAESDIPNFEKFYYPGSQPTYFKTKDDLLRSDSPYSWFNCKQSEHFFLFWDKRFGSDPNSESVPANLRVDTDDLLAKAEQFFHTNVEVLGMCVLGQGKSMLDKYKMQIWIIYDEGWTATGSGWGEIGALWVTPSTCHPVGSTIAHEIGHSFQFQVGADRAFVTKEPVEGFGFRYGFGPNGEGGCAYWEQCAQWQAHVDYPAEQNTDYHVATWLKNYHRHFNHEWMRYQSYYLQTYWTNKRGIGAYGRIWQESNFPEDPIETYTRLYLGGDMQKFYDEYYDYASHMVYYDLDGVREYFYPWDKGAYTTQLFRVDDKNYQVGYASTPGTTGFNVIEINAAPGTTVKASLKALPHGSALSKGDPGTMLNGDGQKVGSTDSYNGTGGKAGYRVGYVAVVNGTPQYSPMVKGSNPEASYTVPANADEVYFVIVATPEQYNSHEWNDNEGDDEQWPYMLTLDGAEVASYEEAVDLSGVDLNGTPQNCAVTIDVHATADAAGYDYAHYNLAYRNGGALCYAFCLMPDDIDARLVHPMDYLDLGDKEGTIVMRLKQTDGTYEYTDNCGGEYGGFWCDGDGNLKGWGEGTYTKLHGITDMEVGYMPGWGVAGNCYPEVVEIVYTKGGKEYIATFTFNFYVD